MVEELGKRKCRAVVTGANGGIGFCCGFPKLCRISRKAAKAQRRTQRSWFHSWSSLRVKQEIAVFDSFGGGSLAKPPRRKGVATIL